MKDMVRPGAAPLGEYCGIRILYRRDESSESIIIALLRGHARTHTDELPRSRAVLLPPVVEVGSQSLTSI